MTVETIQRPRTNSPPMSATTMPSGGGDMMVGASGKNAKTFISGTIDAGASMAMAGAAITS